MRVMHVGALAPLTVDLRSFGLHRLRKLEAIFTHVDGEQLFEGNLFLLDAAVDRSPILLLPVRVV